jgi:tetratricopeptide (TPR) repeat protein
MSILDGLPSTEAELKDALEIGDKVFARALPRLNLTPKQQSVIDLVREGMSLADIMDITQQERDAMFVQGARMIQHGELQKARDVLSLLHVLEPLDAKVIYAIAMTYQLEGDVAHAAKLYVQFLSLNATNAEGYLRLGECLLAAKETDEAASCFRTAKAESDRGNGTPETRARAAQLLALVEKPGATAS